MRSSIRRYDASAAALAAGPTCAWLRQARPDAISQPTRPSPNRATSATAAPRPAASRIAASAGTATRHHHAGAWRAGIPRRMSFELQPCRSACTLSAYLWATANPPATRSSRGSIARDHVAAWFKPKRLNFPGPRRNSPSVANGGRAMCRGFDPIVRHMTFVQVTSERPAHSMCQVELGQRGGTAWFADLRRATDPLPVRRRQRVRHRWHASGNTGRYV
jgi:hypothetical protein